MCINKNSASYSNRYLVSQLSEFWQYATECLESNEYDGLMPKDDHKMAYALRRFCVGTHSASPTPTELQFCATWGRPHIEMICHHEAFLRLTVTEGHLNPQYQAQGPVRPEQNQDIAELEISFRIPFNEEQDLLKPDIKSAGIVLAILAFKLSEADMYDVNPALSGSALPALSHYMGLYLKLLMQAGYHALQSLPVSYARQSQITIDYCLTESFRLIRHSVPEVQGISLKKMNANLAMNRYNAHELALKNNQYIPDDPEALSLAEFRSDWASQILTKWTQEPLEGYFHLKFSAYEFKVRCEHQIVMTTFLEEIDFYADNDFTRDSVKSYARWEVSLIINIKSDIKSDADPDDKLDWASSSFYERVSSFPGCQKTNQADQANRELIIKFLQAYVEFIRRWIPDVVDAPVHSDIYEPEESQIGGYDFARIIPLVYIDKSIAENWNVASPINSALRTFTHDDFNASFGRLTMRLVSGTTAMIWIHITEVTYRAAHGGNVQGSDLRIVFKVPLVVSEHSAIGTSKAWLDQFTQTLSYREHSKSNDCTFYHMHFNLAGAELVEELSESGKLPSMTPVVAKLKSDYFRQFEAEGHHIIYSIPVWTAGISLTSVKVCVHGPMQYSTFSCAKYAITDADAPNITLMGMFKSRLPPSEPLLWSTHFSRTLLNPDSPGLAIFSRPAALDRFVELLGRTSAQMSLVPSLTGPYRGKFDSYLSVDRWLRATKEEEEEEEEEEDGACAFTETSTGQDGPLTFNWTFEEGLMHYLKCSLKSYKHHQGELKVDCNTINDLKIPVGVDRENGLEFTITGRSMMTVNYSGLPESWKSKATAEWHAVVRVAWDTSSSTLKVILKPDEGIPSVKLDESSGPCPIDTSKYLNDCLANALDFAGIVADLRHMFEDTWAYDFSVTEDRSLAFAKAGFLHTGELVTQVRLDDRHGANGTRHTSRSAINGNRDTVDDEPNDMQRKSRPDTRVGTGRGTIGDVTTGKVPTGKERSASRAEETSVSGNSMLRRVGVTGASRASASPVRPGNASPANGPTPPTSTSTPAGRPSKPAPPSRQGTSGPPPRR